MKEIKLTIKSNLWKAVLLTTVKVYIITLIFIGLYKLAAMVGLQIFVEMLYQTGYTVTLEELVKWFSISIIVVWIISIILDIINYAGVSAKFYEDELMIHQSILSSFARMIVPYRNITRITYDNSKLSDRLLKTGTITFYLTGMGKDRASIEFVDYVELTIKKIQEIMENEPSGAKVEVYY